MIMRAGLNLESPRDRIREEVLHATRMGNDAHEPVLVNYSYTDGGRISGHLCPFNDKKDGG